MTQKTIPFLDEKAYCPFYAIAPDSGLVVASVLTTAQELGLLRRRNGETWEFFTSRITFVERDRAGRVIHIAGRALDGKARLKYLFLPGLPKPVYGLARLDPSRPVFVVEGILDYATLWQWGYQAVATLGTSIKAQDARRLARAAQVVFVPNNGEAGEAAAARWREAVGHGEVLHLLEGAEDVNDLALSLSPVVYISN